MRVEISYPANTSHQYKIGNGTLQTYDGVITLESGQILTCFATDEAEKESDHKTYIVPNIGDIDISDIILAVASGADVTGDDIFNEADIHFWLNAIQSKVGV